MSTAIIQFGQQVAGQLYHNRPGAYGLIVRGQQVATTIWRGGYYLPGGGIDEGETPETALHREVMEEIGWTIRLGEKVGESRQYVRSQVVDAYFNKIQVFYTATPLQQVTGDSEPEHELIWLPFAEAAAKLTEESNRWAVSTFLK